LHYHSQSQSLQHQQYLLTQVLEDLQEILVGDDNNTVAIVGGLAVLGGLGYLYATGAFAGGFSGATAGTAGTTTAAKVGKTAVKAAQQPQRSVKRNANTHAHPAIPGVTNSVAHTHMGPMPHTHRYGR